MLPPPVTSCYALASEEGVEEVAEGRRMRGMGTWRVSRRPRPAPHRLREHERDRAAHAAHGRKHDALPRDVHACMQGEGMGGEGSWG